MKLGVATDIEQHIGSKAEEMDGPLPFVLTSTVVPVSDTVDVTAPKESVTVPDINLTQSPIQ